VSAHDCTVEATFSPTLDHQFADPSSSARAPKETPQDSKKMARSGLSWGPSLRSGTDLWTLGIRIGLNKGYETTPIPKKVKPSHLKGRLSKKTQFVRSVVREVVGFAPYERRVLELLRNSKVSTLQFANCLPDLRSLNALYPMQDKKARKLTKKRVIYSSFPFRRPALHEC